MSKKFTVTYEVGLTGIIEEDVDADFFEISGNTVLFKDSTFNRLTAAFADFIKVELKGE